MSKQTTKMTVATVTKQAKVDQAKVKGSKQAEKPASKPEKAATTESKAPVRAWSQSARPATGVKLDGAAKLVIVATENPYSDASNRKHVGKRPYFDVLKGCKTVKAYLQACEKAKLENGAAALIRMANYGHLTIGE